MKNIDFKELLSNFLSLENTFGKKIVTVAYYCVAVAIAINCMASFVSGVALVAMGSVLTGLGKIIFCVPLAVLYAVLLRLFCELANAAFDHFNNN